MTVSGIVLRRRRGFIKRIGAFTSIWMTWPTTGRAALLATHPPTTLNSEEMETLICLLGRLLPSDSSIGGAVEARAYLYIDRALAGPYAKHLHSYHSGLAAITALALKARAPHVRALPPEELDDILTRLEKGEVMEQLTDGSNIPIILDSGGKSFFRVLLQHTLEGTFGDPLYGGNYKFLGWQLIGYRGVQLYYSEPEQALDESGDARNRSVADFGRSMP
jgi:gluconate 2-dehydrogenase gamma chain